MLWPASCFGATKSVRVKHELREMFGDPFSNELTGLLSRVDANAPTSKIREIVSDGYNREYLEPSSPGDASA